jgi:hypothetical protein
MENSKFLGFSKKNKVDINGECYYIYRFNLLSENAKLLIRLLNTNGKIPDGEYLLVSKKFDESILLEIDSSNKTIIIISPSFQSYGNQKEIDVDLLFEKFVLEKVLGI